MVGTSDAVWSAHGTTPDEIEAALRQLLIERHAENDRFAPTRVLNMIVFVDREWSGEIANRLRGVGRYHASRLIVLAYEPRRERLDARVTIAAEADPDTDEVTLLRETVVLDIGDRHLDDLITIADPLVVTDLPTLLWSPHGHDDIAQELLVLSQAVLLDSVDDPIPGDALDRVCSLTGRAYVVDLAWLRSTPWRERIAGAFDPPRLRRELRTITSVAIRHHPDSTVAAMLLGGWLASRLRWKPAPLVGHGGELLGKAHGERQDITLRLQSAPELRVRGLEGVSIETASGRRMRLERGPGGLHATTRDPRGEEREWTIPGASRGEAGILGEGIRQSLLRDPTYIPAVTAARAMLQ